MIRKPQNYDQLKAGYEALEPGGHKCIIKQAEEKLDNSGRAILVFYFDTDVTDAQPKYFSNRYLSDSRKDKKWPATGQKTLWIESEWFESNLSKITGAVEKSDPNAKIWDASGNLSLEALKNKKVGIVFGQEEYTKEDYTVGVAVKPRYFCGYDEAADQKVPEKKVSKNKTAPPPNANPVGAQGTLPDWLNVSADGLEDEGLPFK